jgi:hypothetical protein
MQNNPSGYIKKKAKVETWWDIEFVLIDECSRVIETKPGEDAYQYFAKNQYANM